MIRIFDIIFSFILIIVFSPLFLVIILLLRFTGERKIFFFQERLGLNKKKFMVYKFVTMLENSPNIGAGSITEKNDPRILPLGKILRKTKINELPQVLNVIKGEMSFIGPRPHVERDLEGIPEINLNKVLSVTPGLSGVASIIFRDEDKIIHQFKNGREFYDSFIAPYKAELEIWYLDHYSFKNYIRFIFLTIFKILNFPKINIFEVFPSLPSPPNELKDYISD